MPSLYALHTLFSARLPTDAEGDVHVHLQDYNDLVLRLVTLPNIILAWCEYSSCASGGRKHAYPSELQPNTILTGSRLIPVVGDVESTRRPPQSPAIIVVESPHFRTCNATFTVGMRI